MSHKTLVHGDDVGNGDAHGDIAGENLHISRRESRGDGVIEPFSVRDVIITLYMTRELYFDAVVFSCLLVYVVQEIGTSRLIDGGGIYICISLPGKGDCEVFHGKRETSLVQQPCRHMEIAFVCHGDWCSEGKFGHRADGDVDEVRDRGVVLLKTAVGGQHLSPECIDANLYVLEIGMENEFRSRVGVHGGDGGPGDVGEIREIGLDVCEIEFYPHVR